MKELTLILVLVAIVLVIYEPEPPRCLETLTVTAIKELKYRDAVIELSDGSLITVNQATLKIGSPYCSKWSHN